MKYYTAKTISGEEFSAVRTRVESALKEQGFGVLTEIDIRATMKIKLNKDYLPHVILGACSPVYADQVLSIEPQIGTMLPCNVTIRELESGDIEVSAIDPAVAMSVVKNDALNRHAADVRVKLNAALESL